MIDSHAHLDSPRYDEDRDALLERAFAADVREILSIGIGEGPDTMQRALEIAREYDGRPGFPRIWASAGVHPHEARLADDAAYAKLDGLLQEPEVLACGEIGLDYFYDHSPRDTRNPSSAARWKSPPHERSPSSSIAAPPEHHRRMGRHSRHARDRVVATGLGGILHCFTGELRHAEEAIDLGFLISFAGNITFPKAQPIRDAGRGVPLDRMLIETDAPFLAPFPNRGKRNEPAWVKEVAVKIAESAASNREEVATHTTENFRAFFRTEIPAYRTFPAGSG